MACYKSEKKAPTIRQGLLDLRHWEFTKNGPVELRGEWEFYWKEFLKPEDLDLQANKPMYVQAPASWEKYDYRSENLPVYGYATYAMQIKIPNYPDLSLYVPKQRSSYRLFLNGKLAAQNGEPGISEETTRAQYLPLTVRLPANIQEVQLVLHIANFHTIFGGLFNPIRITDSQQIEQDQRSKHGMELFVTGVIVIICIYHIILFMMRKKDRSALYFGMFCIPVLLRLLLFGEHYLYQLFPNMPFVIFYRLTYVLAGVSLPLFLLFTYSVFLKQYDRRILKYLVAVVGIFCSIFLMTPTYIFVRIYRDMFLNIAYYATIVSAILYVSYIAARAAYFKEQGAWLFLAGMGTLAVSGLNDILHTERIIQTAFLAPFGFTFFIVMQSIMLARKSVVAFQQAEDLSVHLEQKVEQRTQELTIARKESEDLLLNILPQGIAAELKTKGAVEPLFYDQVSVVFTDFVGFTQASQKMMPTDLVAELDGCFSQFDAVVKKYGVEKLKTIGDSYMCAAGLPSISQSHAIDACLAALEFRSFMDRMAEAKKNLGIEFWQIRIGIHSGPVTAGVIGTNKFAYDIWGDTVNTASRMESSGEPGKINISGDTRELIKEFVECEYRGKIEAKGKGELDMYFLLRIKPELSEDEAGLLPNTEFEKARAILENRYNSV